MKRTKENWKDPQPQDRNGISGCFTFDGEDNKFLDRKKDYQQRQKEWIEEQKREKAEALRKQQEEEMAFAKQSLQANRACGLMEGQVESKQKAMMASVRDSNLQIKAEKEAKQKYEMAMKIQEELNDLQYQRDIRRKGAY